MSALGLTTVDSRHVPAQALVSPCLRVLGAQNSAFHSVQGQCPLVSALHNGHHLFHRWGPGTEDTEDTGTAD